MRGLWTFFAVLVAACGGDTVHPAADATDATDAGDATTDATDATDATTGDSASPPDGAADAIPETSGATDASALEVADDTAVLGAYIEHCESLFAARVVELQIDSDEAFPRDCAAPLSTAIGRLKQGGKALCQAGENANACRTRLYETPPALADLDQGCWNGSPAPGCLRGSFLPRCVDASNACAEDEVVCADGTRPMVYAEAATAGPSNVWLFHLGGEGGPCSGPTCWFNYRYDKAEFQRAMSSLHPTGPSSAASRPGGIMSGDTSLPYSRMNRVRFERCTDAASDAIEVVPFADGVPPAMAEAYPDWPVATGTSQAPVWHLGFDTWRATFHHMTTLAGRDRDGDGTPELPSLSDAELVILSGASDASMWVTFAADRLAAELRTIAGPDIEVRMMIDGNFPPMLDNEARYHPDEPASFDMLSMPYSETRLCRLDDNGDGVDNEACSDAPFSEGGAVRDAHTRRGLLRDESCAATHGDDAPACHDRNHVLVHHLGMPVLVLADQEDNTISDSAPQYADDRSYHWDGPATYRKRVADVAWDIVDHWTTSAREEGAGAANGFVLILPKTRREGEPWGRATHVRFGSDEEMAHVMTLCAPGGAKVASASYNQMIGGWLNDTLPQTFAIEDKRRTLPGGNFWITGASCRAPE